MPVFLSGNFHFWRAKNDPIWTILYNFSPFWWYHFRPFWIGTLLKMVYNFKILAKALESSKSRVQKWRNVLNLFKNSGKMFQIFVEMSPSTTNILATTVCDHYMM